MKCHSNIFIMSTVVLSWSETSNLMTINRSHVCFQTNTLDAVLLLLRDLDEEELRVVHTATQNRLQTFTVDSEVFDSLQTEKSVDIQQWNTRLRPNVQMVCGLESVKCFGVCFGSSCWSEGPRCEHDWMLLFCSGSELSDPSKWWCPARYKVATF